MARLALTTQLTPGSYPDLPLVVDSADFEFTLSGGDFADGFSFPWTSKTILLVQNDTVGALTVTINSVSSTRTRRQGDITTYSVGAGEFAVFGPFKADGWQQNNGLIYGQASAATLGLAAIQLRP